MSLFCFWEDVEDIFVKIRFRNKFSQMSRKNADSWQPIR